MSKILVSGGLVPTTKDTLLDVRTRVATFSEIANIENPARFMVITVEDTGKKYEVRKLSSKIIGGIEVENSTIDINDPEALVDLGLAEELRSEDEKVRQSNESKRIEAENLRKAAEDSRKVNETNRVSAEDVREASERTRVSSEETRNANEHTRNSNETKRQSQEIARQDNETYRVHSENDRNASEERRNKSEMERVNRENTRGMAESQRITNENNRKSSEDLRINSEFQRGENERQRGLSETSRNSAEIERMASEVQRKKDEEARASTFETLKGQMQTTIQEGQTAVAATEKATRDAQKVVDNYDAKVAEQDSKLTELGSEVDNISGAIELETTTTYIQGESKTGYINPDSGFLFLIDLDKSVFYCPVKKGRTYKIAIPKTSTSKVTYGFTDVVKSNNPTYNRESVGQGISYEGEVESPINGYILLCYMSDGGIPTVSTTDVASKAIDRLKDYLGEIVKSNTDAAADIPFSREVYSIYDRIFNTEDIIAAKNYIPVELGLSDYVYDSITGVPNNVVFVSAFNQDKKLICSVTNTTGAYIKTANIRDYIPEELWGVVKFLCVNCYTTDLASAVITLKNSNEFVIKKDGQKYNIVSGKTIPVEFSIKNSNITTDYIPVEINKENKIYLTSSGYFNSYASNTLDFYDDLKQLIKSVPASDINYLVNNGDLSRNLVVCVNDYIDESDNVRYIKITNYTVAKGDNFINLYYAHNGYSKCLDIPNLFKGKVMLTYGDSVTEGRTWQNQLSQVKGFLWDSNTCSRLGVDNIDCKAEYYHYEVASGEDKDKVCFKRDDGTYYYFSDDGSEINISNDKMVSVHNRSTGVSGSLLIARPQHGLNYRCVYKRIQEAQSFTPDVIIIYGTYNDVQVGVSTNEILKASFYGTKYDAPYYGLPKEGVTFSSSLKGIFEMLSRTCPLAKVVYVGVYTFLDNPTGKEEWFQMAADCNVQNDLAKEICKQYAIPFVDMQAEFGCNWFNHMKLMASSSPHPNKLGGDRTAEIIASKL